MDMQIVPNFSNVLYILRLFVEGDDNASGRIQPEEKTLATN
jgi:hypothetical protein